MRLTAHSTAAPALGPGVFALRSSPTGVFHEVVGERRTASLGMTNDQSLIPGLDALANWRQSLARELASLTQFFITNELLSAPSLEIAESLRQRILADKLVVAFVAEFSR